MSSRWLAIISIIVVLVDCTDDIACDFDGGTFCRFNASGTSPMWRTRSQFTPTGSGKTGPNNDHTQGTAAGMYAYTEANSNLFREIVMDLDVGHILEAEGVQFWYHMVG